MKRIWHPWHKWECYKAGVYTSFEKVGITKELAKEGYRKFLSDSIKFEDALSHVITEWVFSCEHFLSNPALNKIAWLGQASCAFALGLPSEARGGFKLLTKQQQEEADALALKYYRKWRRGIAQKNREIHREVGKTRLSRRNSRQSS